VSGLVVDDALLDDMARTLYVLRVWLMQMGEEHPDLDASVVDGLLTRYREETGRTANPWECDGADG
jgi:hypothetical protein